MQTIKVKASKEYDVIIGQGVLSLLGKKIKELFGDVKVCIVSDDTVASLYSEKAKKYLGEENIKNELFVFPHGEKSKSPEVLFELLEFLASKHFSRKDVVIALGGGVTGDLTGLGAAMYMRGMHLVQIPTTLLAMVDSSVGGKTAVNLKSGKNLAGVFNQPELVLCDLQMLLTLSSEIFSEGVAEIIKYGVIADRALFELVKNGELVENIENVVARCVSIKSEIVSEDEFDTGKRNLLNFGHTLAHSIEKMSEFKISHGNAVAMGMLLISEIAWKRCLSKERCQDEIIDALLENNLPVSCPFTNSSLYYATENDKKSSSGRISIIVPEEIGNCKILNIALAEFKELLEL
ncbi:MAG: 3-dehydroquinate synthase [Clostridia bacterium]|nr:3-dehydroquinate synthase [Clostridia bacterium]